MKKDAGKIIKRARAALGMNGGSQQQLIRKVRAALGATNAELAAALGVKLPTLYAYLAGKNAAKHRPLPDGLRAVLLRILDEKKRGRGA
jgi:DNA-binding XRE family transcriptional regulator